MLKVFGTLNEAQARWFVAREAMIIGHGGIKKMCELTGLSKPTIIKGIKELKAKEKFDAGERIRRPGAGRKRIEERNPEILKVLKEIMDETTAGDPMSLLKWTSKSTYQIKDQLQRLGYSITEDTVGRILKEMDYSLQANVKVKEGGTHKDRDSQFRYINDLAKEFMGWGDPVISIDAKKKERVGDFKNPGRRWRPKGSPEEVNVYDYPSLSKGTAIPYGAYDIQKNNDVVNVGISHETAEFAVESIRRWWKQFGSHQYPNTKRMLICADGGGSNGSRNRAWKFYLQLLSDEISLSIAVCHYPPGTSKWNKIEHRMFSFISMNWRGQPLVNLETVVNMISATTTKSGLRIKAFLDTKYYKTGIKISDEQMQALNLDPHNLYPQWNYTIVPREK
nr:ISAzo13 family transposase [Candidatus Hakubella thermalkaliphila]